jgi:transcriptional antiterminator NusG
MTKQPETQIEKSWYALHTYSGYEDAVVRNLKQRIESLGMEDKIFSVIVPKEKKIRIKGGKRYVEEEKIYPGYVLVEMTVTHDSWYVVRNTPRVTGFVGAGTVPMPLQQEEVDNLFERMGVKDPKYKLDVVVGEQVKINDGPFKDLEGRVNEIDEERGKIKVLVSMFGRETPVELDFLQVKKI